MEKVENLMAVAMTGNPQGRKWKRGRPNTISGPKAERDRKRIGNGVLLLWKLGNRQRECPFQPSWEVIVQG